MNGLWQSTQCEKCAPPHHPKTSTEGIRLFAIAATTRVAAHPGVVIVLNSDNLRINGVAIAIKLQVATPNHVYWSKDFVAIFFNENHVTEPLIALYISMTLVLTPLMLKGTPSIRAHITISAHVTKVTTAYRANTKQSAINSKNRNPIPMTFATVIRMSEIFTMSSRKMSTY